MNAFHHKNSKRKKKTTNLSIAPVNSNDSPPRRVTYTGIEKHDCDEYYDQQSSDIDAIIIPGRTAHLPHGDYQQPLLFLL